MSLFNELKRRNVIRVAIAYAVVGWLIMQVTDTFSPALRLPEWFPTAVAFLLLIGLPLALFFAWAFELTPDGIRRESEVDRDQTIRPQNARKLDRMIIIALVAVVAVLLLDRYLGDETQKIVAGQERQSSHQVSDTSIEGPDPDPNPIASTYDDRTSVAVIPFVNMSDDEANEYFSDGISEELLNALVHIQSLRVPSRTSSFTFKNSDKKLSEIGRELGVDHILEGSVRKAGDRIRVTAQLIDVKTDTHLWSETYTRELDDIFEVQDEIAKAIVDALQIALSGADQQNLTTHSTNNIQAYNKYLLGRYLWNQRGGHRSGESLLSAVDALHEAVEMDPEYDQAWAALADTYIVIPEYGVGTLEEYTPLAREAVNKALAINPDSARALTASGYIKSVYDFDWEAANSDFERAIALQPGYATAHQWYGTMLFYQGRLEEALTQSQLARIADPLSVVVRHAPGYYLLWSNRLDEAEVHFMDVLDLGQPFRWTLFTLDILNTLEGNYDEARRRVRQLAEMEGFDPAADLARIDAIETPALKETALTLLRERQDLRDGVMGKALQYALLEEYESALESLETGFAIGDPTAPRMNVMQVYEPLHDNPRFQAMLREMNLLP